MIGTEQHGLEGRSVRDIVEHEHDLVTEAWCRKIFRQLLLSLEKQYAMEMPHRAITPDTVVFHSNGAPLLLPSIISDPEPDQASDLSALARLIHYAITQEIAPTGPLAGRMLPGYSESLILAVDRCMDPDPALRPHSIEALRELLGITTVVAPAAAPWTPPELAETPPPAAMPEPTVPGTLVSRVPPAPIVPPVPLVPSASPTAAQGSAAPAPASPPPGLPPLQDAAPAPQPFKRSADDAFNLKKDDTPLPRTLAPRLEPAADPVRRRWPRWAVAGGTVVLVAIALAVFAQWRDPDPVLVALPQTGEPGPTHDPGATPVAPPDTTAASADADVASAPPAQQSMPPAADGVKPLPMTTPLQTPVPTPAQQMPAQQSPAQASAPVTPSTAATVPPSKTAPAATAQTAPVRSAPPAPAPAANGSAVYKLQIQPWGIVYVDGIDRGVSPPVKRLVLTPGRHSIRVSNPNFRERTLEIDTADGDGRIAVDFGSAAD